MPERKFIFVNEKSVWLDDVIKAAEQGDVEAQTTLGEYYYCSHGDDPPNYVRANFWYEKAAEQGNAEAQFWTAMQYQLGDGVPKDREKAKYWCAKAAAQGHHDAEQFYAVQTGGGSFCFIATCVYGSYDCPEVWTLRRFRDSSLSNSFFGRCFIRIYYVVSPKIVELFGNKKWFNKLWKPLLNNFVRELQKRGVDSSPYCDR